MKLLVLLFFVVSCAQVKNPQLVDSKNCKNTCMLRDKEFKGYNQDLGCYCADRIIEE